MENPDRKYVPVDQVRQMREEMFVRPNEGEKKVYIFPQELRIEGQNALLKILEEPPSYGVFLLLTDNPDKLLPTVRSRCVGLEMQGLPEDVLESALKKDFPDTEPEAIAAAVARSGGYLGQARQLLRDGAAVSSQTQAFVKAFGSGDSVALLQLLVPMEKWKRDQMIPELEQWAELVQQALVFRSGVRVLSSLARQLGTTSNPQRLLEALRCLKKAIEYAQGNVSVAAICGYLAWALRT